MLRLSAGIYDTYNDVFKDFLLYERLPERSQAHLFRLGLVAVMQGFRALGGQNRIEVEAFGRQLGKQLGSTYNLLRELRLAGLVVHSSTGWTVSEVARQYEHQGRLGEFVRQSVLRNQLVSEVLVRLERQASLPKSALSELLRARFPFVEAKDEVWATYLNTFLDWLVRLRFVRVDADDNIHPETNDKQEILASLGNLNLAGRGSRPSDTPFVPSSSWSVAVRVLGMAAEGVLLSELGKAAQAALCDLRRIGAVQAAGAGRFIAVTDRVNLEQRVKNLFASEPYTSYWKDLRAGVIYPDAIATNFGLHGLAPGTRKDLGKKLANWGRALGFIQEPRLAFVHPPKLLDQQTELLIDS